MKKLILSCMLIGIVFLTACGSGKEENKDDNSKQIIEVTDQAGTIVRQETDNMVIAEFTQNEKIDKWTELDSIPEDAEKRYDFTCYLLVTEPTFEDGDKATVTVDRETLFYDGESYYIKDSYGCSQIPGDAGKFLETFASKKTKVQEKKQILAEWGITDYNLKEEEPGEDDAEDTLNSTDSLEKKEQEREVTVKDLEKVSKHQKVEIDFAKQGKISMTDLDDIADFYNGIAMNSWTEIEDIPSSGEELCVVTFYQQERKSAKQELVENEKMHLYKIGDVYYISESILKNTSGNNEEMDSYYQIPAEAGNYIICHRYN